MLDFQQDLKFYMVSNNQRIGIGAIRDCVMLRGVHPYTIDIAMYGETEAATKEVMTILGNYIAGIDTHIQLSNFHLHTPVTWLTNGMLYVVYM